MPVTHFVISTEHHLLKDYGCNWIAQDHNYLIAMNELTNTTNRLIAMVEKFQTQPQSQRSTETQSIIDAVKDLLGECDSTAYTIGRAHNRGPK